jgi:hypothetical protein
VAHVTARNCWSIISNQSEEILQRSSTGTEPQIFAFKDSDLDGRKQVRRRERKKVAHTYMHLQTHEIAIPSTD